MPNWWYITINFLYQLGLAIWIGGTLVLGALVAPALFKALPRHQAGAIFGPTLRRFARLRIAALLLVIIGAGVKYLAWETHAANLWIALRWIAIAFLAFTVVYEVAYLERAMKVRQADLTPDLPEGDPRRGAFNRLHHRAEVLMKSSLVAAVVALFLS